VVGVSFSDSREHRKATKELLEKLALANVGKPYAEVYGEYEGRLLVTKGEKLAQFEIYSEVSQR
jgi:hypothetical protein